MTEPSRPLPCDVRVLPACAVIERFNARFTFHRISEAVALPHFRVGGRRRVA